MVISNFNIFANHLARPLVEYLKENHHPHTSIVITKDRVEVMETIVSIPEKTMDYRTL